MRRFRDRVDAGRQLADRLAAFAGRRDVVVLALPRGGVPVAAEVAHALQAPLDVLVVRKLGLPGHEEFAMGAIAGGGAQVLDEDVVRRHGLRPSDVAAVVRREQAELCRRETLYRGDRPFPNLVGRVVVLVDDGTATGATMRAALAVVAKAGAARIIVAAPTVAADTAKGVAKGADDLVAVVTPEAFDSVGEWYDDFRQTTDEDVRRLLAEQAAVPTSTDELSG
jgi:predicted phosphoribosyltransferase